MSFVFKCLEGRIREDERKAYRALISELSVLGHPSIRSHPNICKLEGICWEVEKTNTAHKSWPVLVFEKTSYGDLKTFSSSTAFRHMSLRHRLNLCIEIGTAILCMHDSHIIHGDIKPQNILIYDGEHGQYIAKVTDFGYSTILAGEGLVDIPISVPWNAPEHHHRGFQYSEALKMDVYSFGLLCMWLLFFNSEQKSHDDFLEALRAQGNIREFAYTLMTEESKQFDMPVGERIKLLHFFELALAKDPRHRSTSFEQLVKGLGTKGSEVIVHTFVHHDELLRDNHSFQVTSSLLQFYQVDYLVRSSVAQCLMQKAREPRLATPTHSSSPGPAFQAALCYRLGFSVRRDDNEATAILNSNGLPLDAVEDQMQSIRIMSEGSIFGDGNFSRFQLQGKVTMMELPEHYRELREMDNVQCEYDREIADISANLGELHPITLTLKSTYCSILFSEGYWQRCVNLGRDALQGCIKVYGQSHRKTLQSKEDLVSYLTKQGSWKEAEDLATQLVETRSSILGADHLDTLASKVVLADTFLSNSTWGQAEPLYRSVWETYEVNFGTDHHFTLDAMTSLEELESHVLETSINVLGRTHPSTILRMHNLAATLFTMGKSKEAENKFHESLVLRMDVLGAVHPSTLASMEFLAAQFRAQGKWQDAEALQKKLLHIQEDILPPENFEFMDIKLNLAYTFREQGKFPDAAMLESSVLKITEEAYGQNHPRTLSVRLASAATFYAQGLWKEAARLERMAMDGYHETLGRSHPLTLESMSNLAMTLVKLEQTSDAELLENQSLQLKRQVLGTEHPDTLKSLANLVDIYTDLHRYSEAEKLAIELAEMNKRILGEKHPYTLTSMASLAGLFMLTDRLSQAKNVFQRLLDTTLEELGPHHPNTLDRVAELANTYFKMSRYEAAERLQRVNLQRSTEILGKEHPDTLWRMYGLGSTWLYQDRLDDAERLLTETRDAHMRVLGEEHSCTLYATENLALVLAKQGRFDDAERLERGVVEVRERLFGSENSDTLDSLEFLRKILERDEVLPEEDDVECSDSSWETDTELDEA